MTCDLFTATTQCTMHNAQCTMHDVYSLHSGASPPPHWSLGSTWRTRPAVRGLYPLSPTHVQSPSTKPTTVKASGMQMQLQLQMKQQMKLQLQLKLQLKLQLQLQLQKGHAGRLVSSSTTTFEAYVEHGAGGSRGSNVAMPAWQVWSKLLLSSKSKSYSDTDTNVHVHVEVAVLVVNLSPDVSPSIGVELSVLGAYFCVFGVRILLNCVQMQMLCCAVLCGEIKKTMWWTRKHRSMLALDLGSQVTPLYSASHPSLTVWSLSWRLLLEKATRGWVKPKSETRVATSAYLPNHSTKPHPSTPVRISSFHNS